MTNEEYYSVVTANSINPKGRKSIIESKMFMAKLLSPVHIGNGFNLVKGIDFVKTGNHTFVLDMNKLMKLYGTEEAFIQAIERGNIGAFLDRKGIDLHLVSIATLSGASNAKEIADQLRDGFGYPMIPGSSIKGSIKSAFYAKLLEESKLNSKSLVNELRDVKSRNVDQKITSTLFAPGANGKNGKVPNFDIGRIFRVGDARFDKGALTVISNAILSLDEGRTEGLIPQWMELTGGRGGNNRHNTPFETISILGLEEGFNSARFSVSFDKYVAEHPELRMAKIPTDFKAFANLMNEHAKKMINAEIKLLEDYDSNEDVAEYLDHLDYIEQWTEKADNDTEIQWIQRIGWGSGWSYMTGGSLDSNTAIEIDKQQTRRDRNGNLKGRFMKNYDPHLFPKTRKTVPRGKTGMSSMGWVLMKELK